MEKKPNWEDKAWYLHLESINRMIHSMSDEKELHNIVKYIGYQTNRARS